MQKSDIKMSKFKQWLVERLKIERERFDRSGVYAYTQRTMAYNSNKIEGNKLTLEQTVSLFDNGTLPINDGYYYAKGVEEMNGHFLMFNYMLDTLEGLKEFREHHKVDRLLELMQKEAETYYQECQYFIS